VTEVTPTYSPGCKEDGEVVLLRVRLEHDEHRVTGADLARAAKKRLKREKKTAPRYGNILGI